MFFSEVNFASSLFPFKPRKENIASLLDVLYGEIINNFALMSKVKYVCAPWKFDRRMRMGEETTDQTCVVAGPNTTASPGGYR